MRSMHLVRHGPVACAAALAFGRRCHAVAGVSSTGLRTAARRTAARMADTIEYTTLECIKTIEPIKTIGPIKTLGSIKTVKTVKTT